MQIIDSLLSLYDKKSSDCHCGSCSWEVTESDNLATFRKLTICKDGAKFGIVDNDFYKGLGKMTSERSTFLADKDCDGVSFCEFDGKTHLLFVDLKSNFSKIEDAFRQDFFTLIKMHMFLSICKGYDISNLTIDFFSASPPFRNEDEESEIMDRLNMSDQLNEPRFIDKCYINHLNGKNSTVLKVEDLPYVRSAELHDSILSSYVRFHIFTLEEYGKREGVLDLNLYFNNN